MRESDLSFVIPHALEDVWNVVTNYEEHSWRSDLSEVELGDGGFIELHNSGNKTEFKIVKLEEYVYYELEIIHEQFTGKRAYTFSDLNGKTELRIVDEIKMRDTITELFSFLSMNLKMQQKIFIRDLNKKLGE